MLAEIYPPKDCGKFTQGMIEIGAIVCVPNGLPKCEICPIRAFCGAAAHRTFTRYPVKAAKKERKLIEMTVFMLRCKEPSRGSEGASVNRIPGGVFQIRSASNRAGSRCEILQPFPIRDRQMLLRKEDKALLELRMPP